MYFIGVVIFMKTMWYQSLVILFYEFYQKWSKSPSKRDLKQGEKG